MSAPLEAGLIAALVVLVAGFAAAIIARVVNDRAPLPSPSPAARWVPGPDAATVGIRVGLAQAAVAEADRRRTLAADDAQWVGVR